MHQDLATSPALYWLAVSSVVLFGKMFLLANYQAYHRLTKKVFTNPEDARTFGTGETSAAELPPVERAANAWRNDGENIPIFLGLGIIYVMVGASASAAPWYFMGFAVSRVAHSLTYLAGLQPWRTFSYAFGILCLIGMSVNILGAL